MSDKEMTKNEGALIEKLEKIEDLLQAQQNSTQKLLFWRRLNSGFTLVLAAVVLVVGMQMLQLWETSFGELPQLIDNTNELVMHLNSIDFEALNESLTQLNEGIAEIDFAALNEIIANLEDVSERLAAVSNFFG